MELGLRCKEILIRSIDAHQKRAIDYREYKFYKVDIVSQDSGILSTPCCPSLFNQHGNNNGTMLNLTSSIIFVIGNKALNNKYEKSNKEEDPPSPNLLGSCWIDFSETNPKWRSAPCPTRNISYDLLVPLSGKIYSLGQSDFILEVYNHPQNDNQHAGGGGSTSDACTARGVGWVQLPPPPTEIRSSPMYLYPIPDPQYDRIIVYIGSTVCAFKPNIINNNSHSQWQRLTPPDANFIDWDKCGAIVDGVLYMAHNGHIQNLAAYDLADSTHKLQLEWSQNSTYPDHMIGVEFDDLLYLGNGFLCLAVFTPLHPLHSTRVYFVLLSFNRQTPHHPLVTFTYHYFRQYDLAATSSVLDYVPLGE